MPLNQRTSVHAPGNRDDTLLYYNTVRYILPPEDSKSEELIIPEKKIMNRRVSEAPGRKPVAMTSVALVALKAEIDECQQRLLSGNILMSTAASNQRASWNKNSR